ncbi:MAG: gliding motility-associated C-terminal domain-containing protein [Bacteroidales bacterium]|nr:gliding motility-associated C-terminal domain-containing protein [Bacteroidales bacterium]
MRNIKNKILLLSFILGMSVLSNAQALLNNGGQINARQGSYIYVNGSVANVGGELNIDEHSGSPAELYVSGDIRNNSDFLGDGHIRLLGNWYNNSTFTSNLGTVFFEGANQILGGTSTTAFNNLTLDGSGLKTQPIDQYATGVLDLKHIELQTETHTFFMQNQNQNAILRTTGFVSSLNGGKLSRNTNTTSTYLFPVGSSVGTNRYRPVEMTPNSASDNTYTVRLANLDATLEGYDVSNFESGICEINPLFYHQIDRSSGTSSADINIYFSETADGNWEGISNWSIMPPQWEILAASYVTAGTPLDRAIKINWDDFSSEPYILYKSIIPISFNDLGPYCLGDVPPALPTTSLEGISGTWSPAAINTSNIGTTNYVFTPDAGHICADTYTMSIEIIVCCDIVLSTTVTDPLCYGNNGKITFSASNGQPIYNYTVNGESAVSPFFAPAGNYDIVVTDNYDCSASASLTIEQPPELQVNIITTPAECGGRGGGALASFSGGVPSYSFDWSHSMTGNNLTNLNPGLYTVVVTDGNNCTVSNSGTVGISGGINVSINQLHPISCPLDTDAVLEAVSINAETPASYLWEDGEISSILSNVGAGTYNVSIIDDWGCSGEASITLVDPPAMQIQATVTGVTCFGDNNGSINISVSGGNMPYNYTWSNLFDAYNNVGLSGGDYFVTITDGNACSITESFSVIEPENLVLISEVANVSCYEYADGSISLTATGGVEPYEYTISGNEQVFPESSFYGLPVGSYGLQVRDQNNCLDTLQVNILEPSPISATYDFIRPSCNGNNDGQIEIQAAGGTYPYMYSWNNNSIDIPLISGLTQGIYNITIIDANDCLYELEAVHLEDIDEDCIRIPNAFTPNDDGINDTWIIENLELFSSAYVYVFNRWGQLLYTGRPGDEWEGTYNGNLVPATSYLYVIELYNGSKAYVGTVTVVY